MWLLACVAEIPALDSAPVEDPPFSLLASGQAGGAFLAAATVGDRMLVVGGPMDGGLGRLGWYDGSRFCEEEAPPRTLWWVSSPGEEEWWAVGEGGLVIHEADGERSEEIVDPEVDFYGVWDDGELSWAVGGRGFAGEVWRWDGSWSVAAAGLSGIVFKVWEDWMVGDGSILHLVDGELVDASLWPPPRLLTVRGRAEDEVWAVGGVGDASFMRWDGGAWDFAEIDRDCAPAPLAGVWTAPGEGIWVAGNSGTVAGWDGSAWTCPRVALSAHPFHSAWRWGESVYFFGGNYFDEGETWGQIARHGEEARSFEVGCD